VSGRTQLRAASGRNDAWTHSSGGSLGRGQRPALAEAPGQPAGGDGDRDDPVARWPLRRGRTAAARCGLPGPFRGSGVLGDPFCNGGRRPDQMPLAGTVLPASPRLDRKLQGRPPDRGPHSGQLVAPYSGASRNGPGLEEDRSRSARRARRQRPRLLVGTRSDGRARALPRRATSRSSGHRAAQRDRDRVSEATHRASGSDG
jgi:hypothetical protein